jgi:hypothetical protein
MERESQSSWSIRSFFGLIYLASRLKSFCYAASSKSSKSFASIDESNKS